MVTLEHALAAAANKVLAKTRLHTTVVGRACVGTALLLTGCTSGQCWACPKAGTPIWALCLQTKAFALLQRVKIVAIAAALAELEGTTRTSGSVEVEAADCWYTPGLTRNARVFWQPANMFFERQRWNWLEFIHAKNYPVKGSNIGGHCW